MVHMELMKAAAPGQNNYPPQERELTKSPNNESTTRAEVTDCNKEYNDEDSLIRVAKEPVRRYPESLRVAREPYQHHP